MDKRQALSVVRKYKKAVVDQMGPVTVYLFGSYSKGRAHSSSDIDVAVIVPRVDGDFLKTSATLWRLTMDINTLIEPVLIEECNPSPLYEEILQTGIAV